MRVAWYRFAVTFGRRRGGYLTIVLLIGLVVMLWLGIETKDRILEELSP